MEGWKQITEKNIRLACVLEIILKIVVRLLLGVQLW